MELSKANKKAARQLIEKGLQEEYKNGILNAAKFVQEWESTNGDNRKYYLKLFLKVTDFDEHIADRYDGMTGSKYLFVLAAQLNDGVISEDDLEILTEDVRAAIQKLRS